jgi:hypothetical protein
MSGVVCRASHAIPPFQDRWPGGAANGQRLRRDSGNPAGRALSGRTE